MCIVEMGIGKQANCVSTAISRAADCRQAVQSHVSKLSVCPNFLGISLRLTLSKSGIMAERQTDPEIHKSGAIHVGNPKSFELFTNFVFMAQNYVAYHIIF